MINRQMDWQKRAKEVRWSSPEDAANQRQAVGRGQERCRPNVQ